MAPLSEPERRDSWEICEDRYQVRSTVLTSQLPISHCHEQIGDPTLADAILSRWCTMPTESRCAVILCVRIGARRVLSATAGDANSRQIDHLRRASRIRAPSVDPRF